MNATRTSTWSCSASFATCARYGYGVATDATSAIRVVISSYRIKASPSSNRPSTSLYAMGTFQQDHEYVAGLGDLGECNGRTGVTPEFPQGNHHYDATDSHRLPAALRQGQAVNFQTALPARGA